MKFEGLSQIKHLKFDLNRRELTIFHENNINEIEESLKHLNLGHKKLYTKKTDRISFDQNDNNQRRVLWSVLIINLVFFILEMSYAGYFQIVQALIGLGEVIRRIIYPVEFPNYLIMIIISIFALIGNGICLYLLQKSRDKEEAHMKASLIFTSNDVVINLGVILAGILVYWLNSNMPDLIIGTIVFIIVSKGAFRILSLSKK